MIGRALGPYNIVSLLGTGGMGVVYRAHDPRLGRDVAIKVLPEDFASDEERLARFNREARTAAALTHPHIISIYDFGKVGSTVFVVMELVRGKSLREVLAGGPLPIHDLLKYSMQIAYGLAAAHDAGIIHRDLKPTNLMVTTDGFIKILDFGLAKVVARGKRSGDDSPTESISALTPTLEILGTPAYMSPEQAKQQPLDYRSDQFALGTIMYEMATGKNPFARTNWSEEIVAVCSEEPEPVGKLNRNVPKALALLIEQCLSKNPALRYSATRQIAFELDHLRLAYTIKSLGFKRKRPTVSQPSVVSFEEAQWYKVIGAAKDAFPPRSLFGKLRDFGFGNLVTDAMRACCGTQIAIINTQALRAFESANYLPADGVLPKDLALRRNARGYAPGPPFDLLLGDVLTALPFPNKLLTRTVTGAQLHEVLEHSLSGPSLQISGFRFAFDMSRAPGSRVVWARLDEGKDILPDKTPYTIALTDFINSGGDGYSTLANDGGSPHGPLTDAVARHIETLGTVAPAIEGRIIDVQD